MQNKRLYIIGGCNGAGKTTASFNILPTLLECKEYVNADEIARGISPFQPEKVSFEAGRIMLHRINELLEAGENFAFETTLSTRSFMGLVTRAKARGYVVNLIYFWLESPDLAIKRVQTRVKEGGHNIPTPVIIRRFYGGLRNFFEIYHDICDLAVIYDNSYNWPDLVYEKEIDNPFQVHNDDKFSRIKSMLYDKP